MRPVLINSRSCKLEIRSLRWQSKLELPKETACIYCVLVNSIVLTVFHYTYAATFHFRPSALINDVHGMHALHYQVCVAAKLCVPCLWMKCKRTSLSLSVATRETGLLRTLRTSHVYNNGWNPSLFCHCTDIYIHPGQNCNGLAVSNFAATCMPDAL